VAAVAAVAIFLLVDGGDDPGDVPAGSVVVPDVDGFDRESAIGVMRGAGFADTEIFWRFGCYGFAGEREGLAVRQTPSPGEVVPTQTRVDILLQANDCAPVPDVVGEESAAAAGAVAAAGLVPEIRDECGSPAAAGTVASQQPSPGTEVVEGTVLVLVVEGDC
jgi:beta-lactam-binding protein with PASTA domain